jgi:hypothetical protein
MQMEAKVPHEQKGAFADFPRHYFDLDAVLEKAWHCLAEGARFGKSGFHTANLATISVDGAPSIRTVVVRRFDRESRVLTFHTDIRSRKIAEIEANPRIAMHLYDPGSKIQIRLGCIATINHGNERSLESWRRSRPMSRMCYRQRLAPGERIDTPEAAGGPLLSEDDGYAHFVAISARIETLEWLYLASEGHRRARFEWQGTVLAKTWLAP